MYFYSGDWWIITPALTPRIKAFEEWLREHRGKVSRKSPLGEALKYIAKYWDGLCLFLTDGRIEMDNNAVERTIRPIALNRKNALFAGHDAGAENWAVIASLIETCKLNNIEPHAYLTTILRAIVNGHKQSQIEDLIIRPTCERCTAYIEPKAGVSDDIRLPKGPRAATSHEADQNRTPSLSNC